MTEDKAPRDYEYDMPYVKKGLIMVLTGDGKGKSTSAFGTALRSLGRGFKVGLIQFMKGKWTSGELKIFQMTGELFTHYSCGEGFTWETKNLEKDIELATKTWNKCKEALQDESYKLLVFDEINCCLKYGFLKTEDVIEALKKKPEMTHVILTGRGAPEELIEVADLVTEMKAVKHPFEQGIKAQPGIEY